MAEAEHGSMAKGAVHVEFDGAPGVIRAVLERRGRRGRCGVVGITGAVGSGKSHLARALGGVVVSTDDYLPDYDVTPEEVRDLAESSDLGRLAGDLEMLASGRSARVPRWCFVEHRRVGERVVEAGELVVCEGLHALHERLRGVLDVLVFVEAPAEVRWARAEARERAGERGWSVEYFRGFFERVAEPTFARVAGGYRGVADVVVGNGAFVPGGERVG